MQTDVLEVVNAFRAGDFSARLAPAAAGPEVAAALNACIAHCGELAAGLEELRRLVGRRGETEHRLEPAQPWEGGWGACAAAVNDLIGDLVRPSSEVARVIGAVARGDLSQSMALDGVAGAPRGEFLRTAQAVNAMVERLRAFAGEVTRVAREVGTEGKLGGQADLPGVAGVWKDLTDSVNFMAGNLTSQVRNIAGVTTAVAKGDLSTKITVAARGEILELKNTINTMVDQLNAFAGEVTRVAREVGTEGKLGGQAEVTGVAGVWKDLTEKVNFMAGNLTNQVRNIAGVTTAVAKGDLSTKITVDARGEILELKNTINTMVDQLNAFAGEVTRVAREVGTEGKLGGQAEVKGVGGVWKDLTESVNSMAGNLTNQVRNIAGVTTAVAKGDLSTKITVAAQGEFLELKTTINTMVDQLNAFAGEVTRVAREVGTEGKLGGQAEVKGAAGVWKDLTQNVNLMAANLTTQVRSIAKVVTAVANGNLKRKLALEAKGEISALADTINDMIDTLALFAEQVAGVAREVGVEGRLGGQARVPGAAGIWRDLTNNVNQLAANLTGQVRAIAEVARAVTKGDHTGTIAVDAHGEVAALKDNINAMIRNLRETTERNRRQDWLNTNLARFGGMLQGQRDLLQVARLMLSHLAPLVQAQQGLFYSVENGGDASGVLRLKAAYAQNESEPAPPELGLGEGLIGQAAVEKRPLVLENVPAGYLRIASGLGAAPPAQVAVLPALFEDQVTAVVELATFDRFSEVHLAFLNQLMGHLGIVLNSIAATMRTEQLLQQSQALAAELQSQQEELRESNQQLERQAETLRGSEELLRSHQEQLQRTNLELQEKARQLAEGKAEVEGKNLEVEQARAESEEKARQLAQASQYKSEFLANMSHELRTPLNNLMLLANVLADNRDGELAPKYVKFAQTIHSSGADLLALINDVLDLSKIESGTLAVVPAAVSLPELLAFAQFTFTHVAEDKGLHFHCDLAAGAPATISSDAKLVKQILKNLLANALKFTDQGTVSLRIEARPADSVAFEVADTGIGIPPSQHAAVFAAFRQADGTSSRKYGGTGLGLSISRELARRLGGEILLESRPGEGSRFTFLLPRNYPYGQPAVAPEPARHGEAAAVPTPAERSASLAGRRVLVVDDDPRNIFALTSALEAQGILASHAESGPEGLERLEQAARAGRPTELVLMDMMMPGMDGYAAIAAIRARPQFAALPVIAVTAKAMAADRERCLRAGADAYLAKPVDLSEMLDLLQKWLPRRNSIDAA
ncbi:MAG: HAMP domain-containing protein [Terriglobales bacterium]